MKKLMHVIGPDPLVTRNLEKRNKITQIYDTFSVGKQRQILVKLSFSCQVQQLNIGGIQMNCSR